MIAIAVAVVALSTMAVAAHAREDCGDCMLAVPVVTGGERPELLFAQRAIERAWGPSEDSVYIEVELPGWRSEGLALALSAAVPGAGQIYSGHRRGWLYAVAEVAAWSARAGYRRRGFDLQRDAATYAGTPGFADARWSFDRWEQATQGDATGMRLLFERDRNVFYDLIARDPVYLAGWSGDTQSTRQMFADLRGNADDRLRFARYATYLVCFNHAISSVDALWLSRRHNRPLQERVRIGVRSGADMDLRAALEASF